jgi:hypothetical protein
MPQPCAERRIGRAQQSGSEQRWREVQLPGAATNNHIGTLAEKHPPDGELRLGADGGIDTNHDWLAPGNGRELSESDQHCRQAASTGPSDGPYHW